MKKAETTYVTVARLGSTYGVHGWLKIDVFTVSNTNLLDYQPWYLAANAQEARRPLLVEEVKPHHNGLIVKLAGIASPEEARLLTGRLIEVPRSQLPQLKKDEYYWSDLVGLTVVNKQGEPLGKVIYLLETGSNDVLVVKGNKEIAIPYLVDEVILSVDLVKQEICVDWEPIS